MSDFPVWLSAIAGLFTIAAVLGAAGALYRVTLLRTQVADLRNTNTDLRNEVTDHSRRETELESRIEVLQVGATGCKERISVLEDLLTKRSDDAEIRQGIADLKRVVDEEMRASLNRIEGIVRTAIQDGGHSDA